MSIHSTSNFIFNNVASQNGANVAYQFTQDYEEANGRPYQFRSQTERLQALIGRQGMNNDYYRSGLYCRFYNISNVPPNVNGPFINGTPQESWGQEVGKPGPYALNFSNYFPDLSFTSNVGIVAKGYIYSPLPTTIKFQTVSDDGILVLYDGVPVISNWAQHSAATNTSEQYKLPRGYTPIEVRYYNATSDAVLQLYTNIGKKGFNQSQDALFNNAANRQV